MKAIIDIQRFAQGDVVNYAGNGVDANAGSYNTNLNVAVSNGDLAPEIKTFYNTALLKLAQPKLVHAQFGSRQGLPKGTGKTVEWRKFDDLPKALTPITEGVTPTGKKLRVTTTSKRVEQYGDYVELTDVISLVAVDNIKNEATEKLSDQAALTMDTLVRNELMTGTNVMYCPKVSGGTETVITSRADITKDCKLRVKDVFRAAAELKAVNAPKDGNAYVAIIHPYVAYDLMQEAGDTWMNIQKYTNNVEKIYQGEIGMLGGVRFVESTEAKIYAPTPISDGLSRLTVEEAFTPAGGTLTTTTLKVSELLTAGTYSGEDAIKVWVNGVENTIVAIANNTTYSTLTLGTAIDAAVEVGDVIAGGYVDSDLGVVGGGKDGSAVFCTLFMGRQPFGNIDLEGGNIETIVKPLGANGNDPLNQRSSMGWKGWQAAKILYDQYMIRVESGSEFSEAAEAN